MFLSDFSAIAFARLDDSVERSEASGMVNESQGHADPGPGSLPGLQIRFMQLAVY